MLDGPSIQRLKELSDDEQRMLSIDLINAILKKHYSSNVATLSSGEGVPITSVFSLLDNLPILSAFFDVSLVVHDQLVYAFLP